jgi:hypothetical protein
VAQRRHWQTAAIAPMKTGPNPQSGRIAVLLH